MIGFLNSHWWGRKTNLRLELKLVDMSIIIFAKRGHIWPFCELTALMFCLLYSHRVVLLLSRSILVTEWTYLMLMQGKIFMFNRRTLRPSCEHQATFYLPQSLACRARLSWAAFLLFNLYRKTKYRYKSLHTIKCNLMGFCKINTLVTTMKVRKFSFASHPRSPTGTPSLSQTPREPP